MNSEKKMEAVEFARRAQTACLTTVHGDMPQARMMEVAKMEDDFTVWFTTSACSNKIKQIKENPNACVVFYQDAVDLKILGKAEIIDDKAVKDALYNPKWDRHYQNGGKDDPEYAVIKINPVKAEYRDMQKYGLIPENVV